VSRVEVPALAGLTVKEAEATLKAAGLVVGPVREEPSEKSAGVVIGSSPVADTSVEKGSAVALTVSTGPPHME